jgi:cell division protein FtsB
LNQLGNTSWLSSRQLTQRIAVQQLPGVQLGQLSVPVVASARRAISFVPSWILLAMILMAGAAICTAVTLRARTQFRLSEAQYQRMSSDIESLRRTNIALQVEIHRMTTEPATIESAARERLGMVRPTDIVVPIESHATSNLAALSFVR